LKAINRLTETQRAAITTGLAKQVNTLRYENEEMREEIEDLRAERDKLKERSRPNIKRDAFWKKIQEYPDEIKQTVSQNTITEQPAKVSQLHSRAIRS
jgi:regulator of replication initiation timing